MPAGERRGRGGEEGGGEGEKRRRGGEEGANNVALELHQNDFRNTDVTSLKVLDVDTKRMYLYLKLLTGFGLRSFPRFFKSVPPP